MSSSYYYTNVENGDGSQSPGSHSAMSGGRSTPTPTLPRSSSFNLMRDSVRWLGEQAQTQFLDRNLEAHAKANNGGNNEDDGSVISGINMRSVSSIPRMILPSSYNSLDNCDVDSIQCQTLRFQVIVWSIGCPDVKNDLVSMKFRVTLFWNDVHWDAVNNNSAALTINEIGEEGTNNKKTSTRKRSKNSSNRSIWVMSGRSSAYKKKVAECPSHMIDIPPISILNADSFDVIGQPEVQLLREDSRLMRWSCMYRAQLHQEHMMVNEFPHDSHNLTLKLGILSQRQPGGRWDRRKWRLGLANEGDTQGSIRIPFGLIVDNVKIPEFEADQSGLDFGLEELKHGSVLSSMNNDQDFFLSVKLKVRRESGYYDNNIMPLLNVLNLVSISILALDGDNYFQRGLMSLNIAFVEVGLRMALDSHLPSVGYQIKLQRILNFYFFSILSIALQSSVLKFLIESGEWSIQSTRIVDRVWAIFLLANQAYLNLVYTSFDRWR
ncbi:hypothetical protein ACHAXR_005547 [Thalassiosira sp. AJA248-18]